MPPPHVPHGLRPAPSRSKEAARQVAVAIGLALVLVAAVAAGRLVVEEWERIEQDEWEARQGGRL